MLQLRWALVLGAAMTATVCAQTTDVNSNISANVPISANTAVDVNANVSVNAPIDANVSVNAPISSNTSGSTQVSGGDTTTAVANSSGVAGTQSGTVGNAYLTGLINVNIQNLNLQAQDVIDVSNVLNDNQISLLLQALTSDSTATQNAESMTSALQQQGVLAADEQIVGFKDGKAVKASKEKVKHAKAKGKGKGLTK